jgi:fermentation-respiration switch protein FrsA (DUF1100 family)
MIVALAVVAYLALVVFAFFLVDRMLYLPPPPTYTSLDGLIRLSAPDGVELAALWLPNPAARHTILYFHGNACDLGQEEPFLRELWRRGFAVLAWDYRGYGQSGGRPSEQRLYDDTQVVLHHLQAAWNVPLNRVIAYGRSLGSGPAVELAARAGLGGLIIESGFTSVFRVVTRWIRLPFDRFMNLEKMARVHCPVLVMHGTKDDVIPVSHGKALFAAANEPKVFFRADGAGHYALPMTAGEDYWRVLTAFAVKLEAGSACGGHASAEQAAVAERPRDSGSGDGDTSEFADPV